LIAINPTSATRRARVTDVRKTDCEFTQFCQGVGATCQTSCVTEQGTGKCASPAASVNQGGKTFGTYALDYDCMERPRCALQRLLLLRVLSATISRARHALRAPAVDAPGTSRAPGG
jgi:hypothetical protein